MTRTLIGGSSITQRQLDDVSEDTRRARHVDAAFDQICAHAFAAEIRGHLVCKPVESSPGCR